MFLLLAAGLGAAFAVVADLIAARIAPEYFSVGKGIAAGDAFYLGVAWLAGRAGFIAGGVAGLILLLANRARADSPGLPFARLVRQVWKPLGWSAVLALWLGVLADLTSAPMPPPFDYIFRHVPEVLDASRMHLFNVMWYVHLGLYSGLVVGLVQAVLAIRRERRSS